MGDVYSDYENNLRQQYDVILGSIQNGLQNQAAAASGGGESGGGYEESYSGGGGGGEEEVVETGIPGDPFADLSVEVGEGGNYGLPDITLEWNAKEGRYMPKYTTKPASAAAKNVTAAAGTRSRLSSFRDSEKPLSDNISLPEKERAPLTMEENMAAEMIRKGDEEGAMEYLRGTYPGKGLEGLNAQGESAWKRSMTGYSQVEKMRWNVYNNKIEEIVKLLPEDQRAEARKHYKDAVTKAESDPKTTDKDIINELNGVFKETKAETTKAKAAKTAEKKATGKTTSKAKSGGSAKSYKEKNTNEQGEYVPGEKLVRGLASRRKSYEGRGAWARAMRKEGFSEKAILAAAQRLDSQGIQ